MALYLGVDRSTVSRMENGQSCSGAVFRLLEMLNTNISQPCADKILEEEN